MKKLVELIYKEFQKVNKNSFNSWNYEDIVEYPYITFDLDSENLDRNVEGYYLDVSIFDYGESYSSTYELEEKLKDHFKDLKIMTDEIYARFSFNRSNKAGIEGEKIKRRDLQFYCKVDWRKK